MKRIYVLLCIFIFSATVSAVEMEFTGKATILKNDTRTAQSNSLDNALKGGIKLFLRQNAPNRKADITNDYFVFINEYTILSREIEYNTVVTRVKLDINEMILDDIATHLTHQVNTAVFLVSGLPDYVKEATSRKLVSSIMNDKQFSTKDQIPFEQELIDREDRMDIQNAFQAVAAQYLFNFKINIIDFTAGEGCTIVSEASFISASKINTTQPILRTRITKEAEAQDECVLLALNEAITNSIEHVRVGQIPSPGEPIELLTYKVVITNVEELREANAVMDLLKARKYINDSNQDEYYDSNCTYTVTSYFKPEELAKRIAAFDNTTKMAVSYADDVYIDLE